MVVPLRGARGELVAAVDHRDARQAADFEGAADVPGGEGQRELRRAKADAGREHRLAGCEIEPAAADVARRRCAVRRQRKPLAVALGLFLQQHRFAARGHQRAGADAHGLAGRDRCGERVPGGAFADHPPRPGAGDSVTVHRREVGRGLRAERCYRTREVAADALLRCHRLAAERGREIEEPALRLVQRQRRGHGARQSPLLPPVFSSSRTPSMTMPLSSALAMS